MLTYQQGKAKAQTEDSDHSADSMEIDLDIGSEFDEPPPTKKKAAAKGKKTIELSDSEDFEEEPVLKKKTAASKAKPKAPAKKAPAKPRAKKALVIIFILWRLVN